MTERSGPALRVAAATVLLALVFTGLPAETELTAVMTDEDVVLMFVQGLSADDLIAEIVRREPDFDVSPEMLDELRSAGLPASVIEAMVRRQHETEPAPVAEEVPEETAGPPVLRILLDPDRPADDRPVLTLPVAVHPALASEWRLDDAPESRVFADIAIYLACRTPEHVPDHWRSHSPLGRDFDSMPRHRLIEFVAGARKVGEKNKARLELDVPASIEFVLDPGVPHDLLLGVAVQVAGRYRRIIDDAWPGLVLPDADVELVATVDQRRGEEPFGLVVRFDGMRSDEPAD